MNVDGICIGKEINFAQLKNLLMNFCQTLFGKKTKLRFRPSYFPFTEPSIEIDIKCLFCDKGCQVCSYSQ
jgi:phenylalanyl-tRNA synthetase alpha chain